ncbi:MAG: hypothetical protein COW48_05360 [Hydrogenophilales bacterium CG17_big_fil_post_rev_8_21_14_2_50_63_12]|nr:MAG: hypothetical protein COW48_05360 [Hydrogenophilales bacterium CG17_big_fil_post_rev_8_21_14_2_50_63_12]PIX97694.1 MAG: hypothetical protein COZ24_03825 [Hydrogenophilales bacterium CG_4_10_14_3_um_filter_63_21]PJB03658.1 MAG: hypothetical protein CO126_06365 [Hydrogenophilales bacterium CG_4_9_14_3_um_filter_63_34]
MSADLFSGLDRAPSHSDIFLWADYIELRCWLNPDGYFSLDDAEEALQESADYNAGNEDAVEPPAPAVWIDKMAKRWSACELALRRRARHFGAAYPFQIADGYRGIEKAETPDHVDARWYRFLLVASALQYMPRINATTSAFEEASLAVFKNLLPQGSEVHGFWPGTGRYPPRAPDRITQLAADLRGRPMFSNNAFKAGDRGDSGLDLVAWHPLWDQRNRIPIALAQCGCSAEDWKTKPMSTSRDKLLPLLGLSTSEWGRYYFMPHDMHGGGGQWADGTDSDLPAVIVMDRLRILRAAQHFETQLPRSAEERVAEFDAQTFR